MSSHGPPSVQGRWRGAGDILQFLGHVLANPAQAAACDGSGACTNRSQQAQDNVITVAVETDFGRVEHLDEAG